jgi:holo-[acyl-carrier protein] synthase
MIFGIGVDIIEVERVTEKLQNPLFKERVFSPIEIAYCEKFHNQAEHFAGRFASKEAFLKALGDGWQGRFAFSDIEIYNNDDGKPFIRLYNKAIEVADEYGITSMHVSISHVKEMATAYVILEK